MKKWVFYLLDHRQRSWYEDLDDQNSRLYTGEYSHLNWKILLIAVHF